MQPVVRLDDDAQFSGQARRWRCFVLGPPATVEVELGARDHLRHSVPERVGDCVPGRRHAMPFDCEGPAVPCGCPAVGEPLSGASRVGVVDLIAAEILARLYGGRLVRADDFKVCDARGRGGFFDGHQKFAPTVDFVARLASDRADEYPAALRIQPFINAPRVPELFV